jgi:hypothetical protein
VNAVHISRAFETRAVELAFLLIRRPIKSRGYPAKQERLVTEKDLARLGMWYDSRRGLVINTGGEVYSDQAIAMSTR